VAHPRVGTSSRAISALATHARLASLRLPTPRPRRPRLQLVMQTDGRTFPKRVPKGG
jgi:hypothetical protein